jgi:hypothetical protein
MKVLLINGSPRENGNTARALKGGADTLAGSQCTSSDESGIEPRRDMV